MSGFDFDALRDPLPPEPGARERAAVDARARKLRARARLNRLAVSSVSVVTVVALVFGIVASQRNNGPEITVATSTTPASSIGDRFVPPTSTDNGITTVPVTFSDGETTTLTYPASLRVAQLGFAGGIGVNWPVDTGTLRCCGKVVSISYDTIEHVYGKGATPIKVYRGADGQDVPFFHSPTNAGLDYLAFQFGPWLVQVYDVAHSGDFEKRMTDDQRATWARSLTGTTDANGYLVLHAAAPLSIDNGFDGGFGADPGNHVELATHLYCGQPESDSSTHRRSISGGLPAVSWCVGTDLHVSASGSQSFVDGADHGLQVSDLSGPTTSSTTTTTTTTTTQPATPPSPAVSATFVSPDHGWVLEQNGAVAETTDGGASWHAAGALPNHDAGTKIRFADATHGFAYNSRYLFETSDSGAHWSSLRTPFPVVADLEISSGVLYAITWPPTNSSAAFDFHLWSSNADHLAWTEDPLTLPVGAGGEPVEQLVFSGGRGWALDVMRTVLGGASLSSGRWVSWNPPCATVEGPAYLAASSANDLVALCDEHVWGGGAITSAVYFSHDGGQTFTRHAAPESGLVATPNGTTAIVAGPAGVQRTTDGGVTWHGVFDTPLNAVDLGFTTPAQGFIVFSNGDMLTTHDAGATWQKVTL